MFQFKTQANERNEGCYETNVAKKREVKLWCRKRKGERQSNGETITHAYIIGYIAFNPIGTNNEVSLISCICNERMIDRMR